MRRWVDFANFDNRVRGSRSAVVEPWPQNLGRRRTSVVELDFSQFLARRKLEASRSLENVHPVIADGNRLATPEVQPSETKSTIED